MERWTFESLKGLQKLNGSHHFHNGITVLIVREI
jgi:hypothetical protein